jgi:hypothetical protein
MKFLGDSCEICVPKVVSVLFETDKEKKTGSRTMRSATSQIENRNDAACRDDSSPLPAKQERVCDSKLSSIHTTVILF